jgi:hypothetical protein
MTDNTFEATFVVSVDRRTTWERLTANSITSEDQEVTRYHLPGFDSDVTVIEQDPERHLKVTKDDEPCAGTEIVVRLEDAATGTSITVTQSGFGSWFTPENEVAQIHANRIAVDLEAALATGVEVRRFLRFWGDFGAETTTNAGGVTVMGIEPEGLAQRLGIVEDDMLVTLAGAPIANVADLHTVLCVLAGNPTIEVNAEWVQGDRLLTGSAPVVIPR